MRRTHYQQLGVSEEASAAEIKRAFRAMAKKYHPDRNSSPEAEQQFKQIKLSYEILSDDVERQLYDITIGAGENHRGRPTRSNKASNIARAQQTRGTIKYQEKGSLNYVFILAIYGLILLAAYLL